MWSKHKDYTMSLSRTLRRCNKWHLCVLAMFLCVTVVVYSNMDSSDDNRHPRHGDINDYPPGYKIPENNKFAAPLADRQLNHYNYNDNPNDLVSYKKDTPLIWIGGVPRSGTTLMRAMLDAHPDVRCGEETRVIPRILGMHSGMTKSQLEMTRLKEAKIDENVLNNALAAYILSIISLHGEPAPRLCNKDPFTLRSMSRIVKMFPQSKFLLMVRDGRATAHSIISRKVTIKGFDIKTYKGAIKDWNRAMGSMYTECETAGPETCLPVYYEQLVLHPEGEMRKILNFLNIPWNDIVIHHEKTIGQTGGVSLSKKELSTDQVDKPVNLGALTKWAEHIPDDVRQQMREIAPMLEKLGYDPDGYPPNYGEPDEIVVKNSEKVQAEREKLLAQGIDMDKLEKEKIQKRQEEDKKMLNQQGGVQFGLPQRGSKEKIGS